MHNKTLMLQVFFLFLLFASCSNSEKQKTVSEDKVVQTELKSAPILVGQETEMLLRDLAENGDYVNGRDFPSLIDASKVMEQLDGKILLVDIRSTAEFQAGHIKGAVQKDFNLLPAYFQTGIKPFEYERIVLVSADGQTASYTTMLLRLMGYGNVYAMRWGMSSWNSTFAQNTWLKGSTSDFQDRLETKTNEVQQAVGMPELNTGKSNGEEIGAARFNQLFSEGLNHVTIDAKTVFAKPEEYYVINYERRDKYESGHIPGAVRYKPGATLSMVNEMATIPSDKIVVVYCGTGHNSAFVTAYLRLFGYDARTLHFGNNSFMYNKMVADRTLLSWLPFTSEEIYDYEVVK